jgi:hypothetical protein
MSILLRLGGPSQMKSAQRIFADLVSLALWEATRHQYRGAARHSALLKDAECVVPDCVRRREPHAVRIATPHLSRLYSCFSLLNTMLCAGACSVILINYVTRLT